LFIPKINETKLKTTIRYILVVTARYGSRF